jgi:hypothetical protein
MNYALGNLKNELVDPKEFHYRFVYKINVIQIIYGNRTIG